MTITQGLRYNPQHHGGKKKDANKSLKKKTCCLKGEKKSPDKMRPKLDTDIVHYKICHAFSNMWLKLYNENYNLSLVSASLKSPLWKEQQKETATVKSLQLLWEIKCGQISVWLSKTSVYSTRSVTGKTHC